MNQKEARSRTERNTASKPSKSPAKARRLGRATSDAVLGTGSLPELAAQPVAPKWAWHQRVLLKLRERLIAGRDQHRQQGSGPSGVQHTHLADNGTDEFDVTSLFQAT